MQKRDENMCMCIVNTGGTGPAYVRGLGCIAKKCRLDKNNKLI
jgi:hypothetical protein